MFRILSACLLFLGLFIVGCQSDDSCTQGSGTLVTEMLSATEFQTISNASLVDINLQVGVDVAVSLTAEDNIIEDLEFNFRDTSLDIESNIECISTNQEAQAEITIPSLIQLINTGNGDVTGAVRLIDAEIVNSSNGDIELLGDVANSVTVTNTGNGEVSLDHRISGIAIITNAGNGDIHIVVDGSLEGAISGNGDVYYKGIPLSIDVAINGNGELIDDN